MVAHTSFASGSREQVHDQIYLDFQDMKDQRF
jgi:hypothetical protein